MQIAAMHRVPRPTERLATEAPVVVDEIGLVDELSLHPEKHSVRTTGLDDSGYPAGPMKSFSVATLLVALTASSSACGSSDDPAPLADSSPAEVAIDAPDADVVLDTFDATPPPTVVVSQADDSKYEAEPQVAVAPDGTIGVAWIATPNTVDHPTAIGYAFSRNHGVTFTAPQYIFVTKTLIAGDPSIAATNDGAFHLSYIDVIFDAKGPVSGHVFAAIAPKGSDKFGDPVEVSDPTTTMFRDHPKLAITAEGTTIIAYLESTDGTALDASGIAATSKDGVTWRRSVIVPSEKGGGAFFFPCQPREGGRVYVTYLGASGSNPAVILRTSDDDGVTWSLRATVVSTTKEAPPAAHDPSCVAAGDDVWINYAISSVPLAPGEADHQEGTGIRVAHSADRGATIAARVDAQDPTDAKLNLFPTIAREDEGALDVVYYAGASDGDSAATLRRIRSIDGAVFTSSERVDGPLLFQLKRASADWLGDYICAVPERNDLWIAWTTNASGTSHVAVRRINAP
jgi:hypothetical protein